MSISKTQSSFIIFSLADNSKNVTVLIGCLNAPLDANEYTISFVP